MKEMAILNGFEVVDDKSRTNINTLFSNVATLENNIAVANERINNLSTMQEGSTTADAELIDIRIGADGVTYSSAGESVRTQFTNVSNKVDYSLLDAEGNIYPILKFIDNPNLFNVKTITEGLYKSPNGTLTPGNSPEYACFSEFIRVKPLTDYITNYINSLSKFAVVLFYDKNRKHISSLMPESGFDGTFTTPANCYYVVLNISYAGFIMKDSIYLYENDGSEEFSFKLYGYGKTSIYEVDDNEEFIEVITEFEEYDGYIIGNNSFSENGQRTGFVKIKPNSKYYMNKGTNEVVGAFFDINKRYIKILNYVNDLTWVHPLCFEFTTPANAEYIVINYSADSKYRLSISNKPLVFPNGVGNFKYSLEDKVVDKLKNKNICFIGDSITMIDRSLNASNINNGNFLYGFQEYVSLLFNSYKNYGFSGGTWGQYDNGYDNIYDGIVTANVDLSSYDYFVLLGGYNGMATSSYEMGDIGTFNENTSPTTSQLGALRGIIDYIFSQNANAKIFLCTNFHSGGYYTSELYRTRLATYNSKVKELCELMGLTLIDLEKNAGFNVNNYNNYTYDGLHPNNTGMKLIADVMCKEIFY